MDGLFHGKRQINKWMIWGKKPRLFWMDTHMATHQAVGTSNDYC